jgi:CIC family chloride channel protein
VAKAFRTRLVVATLVGTASALLVARWVTGGAAVLPVGDVDAGPGWVLAVYAVLGLLLGALGVAYNRVVVLFLGAAERVRGVAPEVKAAGVAVVVVLVGLAAPWLVGGGDTLNETILLRSPAAGTLVVILLVRWVLGPLSYSVATPGGLFAPLLVLGAASGALLAIVLNPLLPGSAAPTTAFAVVGMSSFFAAVVRAPVTGVVLIAEMTAQTTLVLPMVVGSVAAVVLASLLHGLPVYDSLRLRMERATTAAAPVSRPGRAA